MHVKITSRSQKSLKEYSKESMEAESKGTWDGRKGKWCIVDNIMEEVGMLYCR